MSLNDIINHIYKGILFVFAVAFLSAPEAFGEWEAQRDIEYDLIWSEYLMDYTCEGDHYE